MDLARSRLSNKPSIAISLHDKIEMKVLNSFRMTCKIDFIKSTFRNGKHENKLMLWRLRISQSEVFLKYWLNLVTVCKEIF